MFSSGAMFAASQTMPFGDGSSQMAGSPESAAKKPRQEEKQTCLPVTIRAMEVAVTKRLDAGEDITFYGCEPGALILVAVVESVVRQSTGLEMMLNDATGRIKARYFVTDPQLGELERITPGTYISAFGSVRSAPAVHFAINGLRPVESADEVSYHMIEVAHAMLRLQQPEKALDPATPAPKKAAADSAADFRSPEKKRVLGEAAVPSNTSSTVPVDSLQADTLPMDGGSAAAPAAQPAPAPSVPAASAPPKGAELRAALLALLRDADADAAQGTPVSTLLSKLPGVGEAEVRATITSLVDDGEIYSTVDDEHFAAI